MSDENLFEVMMICVLLVILIFLFAETLVWQGFQQA